MMDNLSNDNLPAKNGIPPVEVSQDYTTSSLIAGEDGFSNGWYRRASGFSLF